MYLEYFPVTYYFYPLLSGQLDSHNQKQKFLQKWNVEQDEDIETLLYIHIPYCSDMCKFCPFHVRVDKDFAIYDRYTDVICKDLIRTAEKRRSSSARISAIYFGGGSPSVLPIRNLTKIFKTVKSVFTLTENVEISFEGEPKTLADKDKLEYLKNENVKRLSFGVQTYDSYIREIFNISASLSDIDRVMDLTKQVGFDEVNVDMMYNLPGQTLAGIEKDISSLVRDSVDSVDYYNLHYFAFPKKFKEQMKSGVIPPKPSDSTMLALFEQLKYSLGASGYYNVADQIYSKRNEVCDYFRLLWGGGSGKHNAETIAIGSSARGYVDGFTYMNFGNVNKYMKAIESGETCVEKISDELLYPENRGAVMFPKFLEINKECTRAVDTIPPLMIKKWIEEGLVYENDMAFKISEKGKVWTNNMTTDLFERAQVEIGEIAVLNLKESTGTRTGTF